MQYLIAVAMALFSASVTALELFEGDIAMSDNVRRTVSGASGYDAQVTGHWPGGIVPYTFSSNFDYRRRGLVKKAIDDFAQKTCVRFVPRTNQWDYAEFIIGGGCYSMIGKQGRRQQISIGNGCTSHGTIVHEMMHAIGFYHEQSRLDRDKYVNIYWQNIPSKMKFNFQKYRTGAAVYHGEPYDYASVMHYERTSFGGGRVTIAAKNNYNLQLGQHRGFSIIDLRQINKMYKCSGKPGGTLPPSVAPPKPGGCTDSDPRCPAWAQRGECRNNAGWMSAHCKKSCNTCQGGCQDNHSKCGVWAYNGECHKNPKYMLNNCKKSCRQC